MAKLEPPIHTVVAEIIGAAKNLCTADVMFIAEFSP